MLARVTWENGNSVSGVSAWPFLSRIANGSGQVVPAVPLTEKLATLR